VSIPDNNFASSHPPPCEVDSNWGRNKVVQCSCPKALATANASPYEAVTPAGGK